MTVRGRFAVVRSDLRGCDDKPQMFSQIMSAAKARFDADKVRCGRGSEIWSENGELE